MAQASPVEMYVLCNGCNPTVLYAPPSPPPPPSPRRRRFTSDEHRNANLVAVYSDFVHTAVTYGRTIISEYFLHEYMKSVRRVSPCRLLCMRCAMVT